MAEQRGDFSYEDIMTLFRQENRSPQLTKVDPALYDKVATYIRTLRKEGEREIIMNSGSHASMMLSDQLKKAIDKSKRVYELRTRKISLIALRKVAGDNPDTTNLTPDELVLFSSLTSVISAHRDSHADYEILGSRTSRSDDMVEMSSVAKAEKSEKPEDAANTEIQDDLVLARVLEDVPTFAGVDKDYRLRKEDIVSLPRTVATTLLSHGKIRLVSQS